MHHSANSVLCTVAAVLAPFVAAAAPSSADDFCAVAASLLVHAEDGDTLGFGDSVAMDGETAVIGAPADNEGGRLHGSVYVFLHQGNAWIQSAELIASDGEWWDGFGNSVDISGDTIVVGAPLSDDVGSRSGSAYVFTRSGQSWSETVKLLPSVGAANDRFGNGVAIDDDTIVIGARGEENIGSAFVFTRKGEEWVETDRLFASDGEAHDLFGDTAALDGDTLVLSARGDDDNGDDAGAAYVFTRRGDAWTEVAKLLPSAAGLGDYVGPALAIDGDVIVVGRYEIELLSEQGNAYVFERIDGAWIETAMLVPDGIGFDRFGSSVSVQGDVVLVGAPDDQNDGIFTGAVYLFARDENGSWIEQEKFVSDECVGGDKYGHAVALCDGVACVSAWGDDDLGESAGAVYFLNIECVLAADLNGDGIVDEHDRTLLCSALGASFGQPGYIGGADLNNDLVIDHLDLALFNHILPSCAGDVVSSDTFAPPADGIADGADLAYLLGAWGGQPSCADIVTGSTFRPPPDGIVDGADLAFLLGAWGPCP